jgi:MoaA/NifB/PqqE/SkfB family radical SAM enzyme
LAAIAAIMGILETLTKITSKFNGKSSRSIVAAPEGFFFTEDKWLTRRGIMWLGQTCNQRCHFCYFLNRIQDTSHPEHPFMSLEKAKQIAHDLRFKYNNNSLEIEGGESLLWPHINEFVAYCREIGIPAVIITNGTVLSSRERCLQLKQAGIKLLEFSVHGTGALHDRIVGLPGAFEKQWAGIRNARELGIPFGFNVVLTSQGAHDLENVAKHAVREGALVVQFLAFNPFEDQQELMKGPESIPLHSEIAPHLTKALDILYEGGLEANVRYFPMCLIEERHRKSAYHFQQNLYDPSEWDMNSWHWTRRPEQMRRGGECSPHHSSFEALIYGSVEAPSCLSMERKYRTYVRHVLAKDCQYVHPTPCQGCDLRNICEGVTKNYFDAHGSSELKPVELPSGLTDDPLYYTRHQEKLHGHWQLEDQKSTPAP